MFPFAFLCCSCHQERSILVVSVRGDYSFQIVEYKTLISEDILLVAMMLDINKQKMIWKQGFCGNTIMRII